MSESGKSKQSEKEQQQEQNNSIHNQQQPKNDQEEIQNKSNKSKQNTQSRSRKQSKQKLQKSQASPRQERSLGKSSNKSKSLAQSKVKQSDEIKNDENEQQNQNQEQRKQTKENNSHQNIISPVSHQDLSQLQHQDNKSIINKWGEQNQQQAIKNDEQNSNMSAIRRSQFNDGKKLNNQQLQLTLQDKLRQIKQLKDDLKKQKQKNKLLQIQLGLIKSEHAKCPKQSNKQYKPLPPTRNLAAQQKMQARKKAKGDDDFWNIQPPEIIRRKNQQQSVQKGADILNIEQTQSVVIKPSPLVRPKYIANNAKQSNIRVKKSVHQSIYDDDQADFWNANLPESLNKRKQDLLTDSNLWINQLHIKNPKLPALPIAITSKK